MTQSESRGGKRKGPLKPQADIGEVLVENPPSDALLMTPDEADVSAIRLMETADKARRALKDPDHLKR
ncbi:MAG: hypothetical protein EON89_05975 [Brevundimonas sp.]|nr:MAG: hypothetical protein EON89_05975 [Brevundimonas sp.]